MRLLLVCLGGAIGSGARYLTALWAASAMGPAFPFGTLIVNLLGSFLIAFIMHIGSATEMLSPELRVMLTTGVMGGFTTYSTFSYETMRYLQDGTWALALLNVAVTTVVCLAACFLGWGLAQWLAGPSV